MPKGYKVHGRCHWWKCYFMLLLICNITALCSFTFLNVMRRIQRHRYNPTLISLELLEFLLSTATGSLCRHCLRGEASKF